MDTSRIVAGSPPQVRGKLLSLQVLFVCTRITPAGAGKTVTRMPKGFWKQDHPRRCGENSDVASDILGVYGSPPQVRGKLYSNQIANLQSRITPAGAGKTCLRRPRSIFGKDHPRRCGENAAKVFQRLPYKGSPPQVRGKRFTQNWESLRNRITPAGAGKTVTRAGDTTGETDHPRRCGENEL